MKLIIAFFLLLQGFNSAAQQGWWNGQLHRIDNKNIVFTFEWTTENGKPVWYIHNADEKLKVDSIIIQGDSLFIQMPVFESQFRLRYSDKKLNGFWIKNGVTKTQSIPFSATPGTERFEEKSNSNKNISGRWAVHFSGNDPNEVSVAAFKQSGNIVSGTFLNSSGDYRYLEGIVYNDSLLLSGFDGSHAFLFTAKIKTDTTITDGTFFSGASYKEKWFAVKDPQAKISLNAVAMFVKPGEDSSLHFTFNDLEKKPVSIYDARFKNKVVIIQLMGSWCPNCMDETAFLSDYYNKNKQRGIEIIALAYEYTTDWNRSVKSLQKFQRTFNVQYPILNTGVTVMDSLKTEKTLPELTEIKTFPTSIIIDKKGKIRKLDTSFNGPATGIDYIIYKKEFEDTITALLNEN